MCFKLRQPYTSQPSLKAKEKTITVTPSLRVLPVKSSAMVVRLSSLVGVILRNWGL